MQHTDKSTENYTESLYPIVLEDAIQLLEEKKHHLTKWCIPDLLGKRLPWVQVAQLFGSNQPLSS